MRTPPPTPGTRHIRTRIRILLARHDELAGRYADALIAGQEEWADARKRRLDALAKQIAHLARQHGLKDWTRQCLKRH